MEKRKEEEDKRNEGKGRSGEEKKKEMNGRKGRKMGR
jgi:hypothetical protein